MLELLDNSKKIINSDWFELRRVNGFDYVNELKTKNENVIIFPFTIDPFSFILRIEPDYPHGRTQAYSSITGGVQNGMTPKQAAINELEEEAGIKASVKDLIDLGVFHPHKSCATKYYVYGVNYANMKMHTPLGDGSYGESISRVIKCKIKDISRILNCKNPYNLIALTRLIAKGILPATLLEM